MCKFKLFSIAAAALMMVACSNEDLTQQTQTKAGKMQFSATIAAPSSGATTRTIYTEDTQNKKITVAWKVDDEIALVHNGVKDVATVKTINSDGSATITGYVTGATNNADVRLVYPAARVGTVTGGDDGTEYTADETVEGKLKTQDGTLAYIQDNLDFREDMGQLAVSETGVTLAEKAGDISPLLAIWKLTLSDGTNNLSATQVKIKGGESVLASTTTLATATSVVTLAIPTDVYIDGALTIEATVGDDTYAYTKAEGATFNPGTYYQSTVTMAPPVTDLSKLTGDYTAKNGETLTGTLAGNYKISIAAGATVTLDEVTINGENDYEYAWAGITCEGDATIILKDGSTNTVKGFDANYPGIYVPSGNTLTIKGETKGTGSLNASSNGSGAGIGGGNINCGNIEIQGGKITATGGSGAAGIGSGSYKSCGTITISGGTITANGGEYAAGIGTGYTENSYCGDITISGGTVTATGGKWAAAIGSGSNGGSCGAITITSGVTSVTATKGASAPNSIGAGNSGRCGTVTIGCTLNNDGNPVGGTTGAISTSPYTYDPNAPAALAANEYNLGEWNGTKVVFTKKTAEANPKVVEANTMSPTSWSSGWYTVSGDVTITGDVILQTDVHLILQDGAKLTINGQLNCYGNKLYIYGQAEGDGKLNVTSANGHAIVGDGSLIEIHGGVITVEATNNEDYGIRFEGLTGSIKMYGGKLTATSVGTGIYSGGIEVYGGEVDATSTNSSGIYCSSSPLIVYGGKVKGTGASGERGFDCQYQSGTVGITFYFGDNGTSWDQSDSSATDHAANAPLYRYAKAE